MSFRHLVVISVLLALSLQTFAKGSGFFTFDVKVNKTRSNSISGEVIISVTNMQGDAAISLNVRSDNNCFKVVSGLKNVDAVKKKKGELFRRKIHYKLYNLRQLCSMVIDVDAVDSINKKQSITKVAELNESP
jgi:hypothetical protein